MRKWFAFSLLLLFVLPVFFHLGCTKSFTGRVWLLGIDGADWRIIDPLIESGRAPAFAKLKQQGAWGELQSIDPMLSPIIWTSIVTGKTPEKHGITWFMVRNKKTGRMIPVTSNLRQCQALWNILSTRDVSVAVTGWWASWPAESVNGWVATDHLAYHGFGVSGVMNETREGLTYPASMLDELTPMLVDPFDIPKSEVEKLFPLSDAEFATAAKATFDFSNPLHHTLFALASFQRYQSIAHHLDNKNATFNAVYFEFIDTLSHLYMKYRPPQLPGLDDALFNRYRETIDRVYLQQDRLLGQWLDQMGEDDILIVVSDHGFKIGDNRPIEVDATKIELAHLWHAPHGVIAAYGRDIRPGHQIDDASVLDITPTILYLLDQPVADDFDGKVLTELFTDAFRRNRQPQSIASYESGSRRTQAPHPSAIDPQIEARLKSLGYLGNVGSEQIGLNRAKSHHRKGNSELALQLLEEIHDDSPLKIDALLMASDIARDINQLSHSYQYLKQALVSARQRKVTKHQIAQIYLRLGDNYHREKRTQQALNAFAKAIDNDPSLYLAHFGQAVVYHSLGKVTEAKKSLNVCLSIKPDYAPALYLRNQLGVD